MAESGNDEPLESVPEEDDGIAQLDVRGSAVDSANSAMTAVESNEAEINDTAAKDFDDDNEAAEGEEPKEEDVAEENVFAKLAKEGDWLKALALLGFAKEGTLKPNPVAYTTAANACRQAKQWETAIRILLAKARKPKKEEDKMDRVMYGPDGVPIAAHVATDDFFSGGGQDHSEEDDREAAQVVHQSANTFCAVASACAESSQWQMAVALIQEMHRKEVVLNASAYNVAISACRQGKHWEGAINLISDMKVHDVQASPLTYNTAISTCAREMQWQHALALLRDMQAKKVQPNVASYNGVLSSFTAGSLWYTAIQLLREMQAKGVPPNMCTYNTLIGVCAVDQAWERAIRLLSVDMLNAGFIPTTLGISAAVNACTRAHKWQQALVLLDDMQHLGATPDFVTFAAATTACSRSNAWEHAVALFAEMRSREQKVPDYLHKELFNSCARCNEWAKALELFDSVRKSDGTPPSMMLWETIASAINGPERYELVFALLEDMKDRGIKPSERMYDEALQACEFGAKAALAGMSNFSAGSFQERARELKNQRDAVDAQPTAPARPSGVSRSSAKVEAKQPAKANPKAKRFGLRRP